MKTFLKNGQGYLYVGSARSSRLFVPVTKGRLALVGCPYSIDGDRMMNVGLCYAPTSNCHPQQLSIHSRLHFLSVYGRPGRKYWLLHLGYLGQVVQQVEFLQGLDAARLKQGLSNRNFC